MTIVRSYYLTGGYHVTVYVLKYLVPDNLATAPIVVSEAVQYKTGGSIAGPVQSATTASNQ